MEDIDKRLYIYNLVVRYKEELINNTILYYIRGNNISYSENNNGFFLNLTTLDDEHIDKIYNLIQILDINEINADQEILQESSEENDEDSIIDKPIILTDKGIKLIEYTKTI